MDGKSFMKTLSLSHTHTLEDGDSIGKPWRATYDGLRRCLSGWGMSHFPQGCQWKQKQTALLLCRGAFVETNILTWTLFTVIQRWTHGNTDKCTMQILYTHRSGFSQYHVHLRETIVSKAHCRCTYTHLDLAWSLGSIEHLNFLLVW